MLGIILVSVFWKKTIILSLLIVSTAIFKHKIIPIKKEFLWFTISGIVGPITESLIMMSGPWVYTNPSIFNFPVWLIFLWGFAGTLGISLYNGITDNKA